MLAGRLWLWIIASMPLAAIACVGDEPEASPIGVDGGDANGNVDAPNTDGGPNGGDGEASTTPPCRTELPWGVPEAVPDLNSVGDAFHTMSARVVANGIYFASDRKNPFPADPNDLTHLDLYFARANASGTGFEKEELLNALSKDDLESSPTESADGLSLFFDVGSGAGPAATRTIHRATRQSRNTPYTSSTALALTTQSPVHSWPYVVGGVLYFGSNLPSDAGGALPPTALYQVTIDATGPVGTPVRIPGFENSDQDLVPIVSADQKTIYLSRYEPNNGGTRVWTSTRGSLSIQFPAPTKLDIVNTGFFNSPASVSADGCTLYLHQRGPATTRYAIYRSRKPAF